MKNVINESKLMLGLASDGDLYTLEEFKDIGVGNPLARAAEITNNADFKIHLVKDEKDGRRALKLVTKPLML